MKAPRPMTDAECDALLRQRPRHGADLTVGNLRVWICRYPGFADPLVTVWAGMDWVYRSLHMWFPGATPRTVREWAETLPQAEPVKQKRPKIQAETELAA